MNYNAIELPLLIFCLLTALTIGAICYADRDAALYHGAPCGDPSGWNGPSRPGKPILETFCRHLQSYTHVRNIL